MSGVVDLPLVLMQKAQHAAEAAAAFAKLFETGAGNRLTAIEARLVGVEARLSSLYAGQGSHTVTLTRIADIQSEHTTTLAEHTARFDKIEQILTEILAKLA